MRKEVVADIGKRGVMGTGTMWFPSKRGEEGEWKGIVNGEERDNREENR